MNEIELYVNKKFDILKVIKMVLKRKSWGETYTLYSTPTHEVLITMVSYNFLEQYATFSIKINEKNGNGYYSNTVNIYNNRDDYTISFVNRLLLKKTRSYLEEYRKSIFEKEAQKLYPYIWRSEKPDEEWIEEFGLEEKIEKINSSDLEEEDKETMIDNVIEKQLSKYEEENCYEPRKIYVDRAMESEREKAILDLIKEIEGELSETN